MWYVLQENDELKAKIEVLQTAKKEVVFKSFCDTNTALNLFLIYFLNIEVPGVQKGVVVLSTKLMLRV